MAENIQVKITGDSTSFVNAAGRAEKAAGGLSDEVKSLAGSMSGVLSVGLVTGAFLRAADDMKDLESRLRLVTSSSQELAQVQKQLYAQSQQSKTSLQANADLYTSLARSTEGLEISQTRLLGLTDGISKAFVVSGAGAAEMDGSIRQLGQALQSGALRGDEFNSMMEGAPRLMRALADGMGVAIGSLRDMAQNGQLTTDVVLPALEKGLTGVRSEFDKMAPTVGRATQALSNAFSQWVADADNASGITATLAGGITTLAENFDLLTKGAAVAASVVAGQYLASAAASTKAMLAQHSAAVQVMVTEAEALAVKKAYAAAQLEQATTAAAAATGMQRLAVVQSQLIPAQRAYAAATTAANAASAATIPMMGLARGALAALGGPIGLVTTALSVGATAWMLWGEKTEVATANAAKTAMENLDVVINKLGEMNSRLASVTKTSYETTVASAASELKTVQANISYLSSELDRLDNAGGRGRFSEAGKAKQQELNDYLSKELKLQQELSYARSNAANAGTSALNQFIEANAVGAEKVKQSQQKVLAEYADAIKMNGGVFDQNNKLHVAALSALNTKLADIGKTSKGSKKEVDELSRMLGDISVKTTADQSGLSESTVKALTSLGVQLDNGRISAEQYNAAMSDLLDQDGELAKEQAEITKHLKDRHDWLSRLAMDQYAAAENTRKSNTSLQEEIDTLGMSAKQLADYRVEKLSIAAASDTAAAAQLDAAAALLEEAKVLPDIAAQYRALAEAKRESAAATWQTAALQGELEVKSAAVKAAEDSARAWENFGRDIEQSLTDSLYRAFENGEDAGQALAKSLENTFKTMVLKVTVQAVVNVGAGAVSSLFGSSSGTGGTAGAVGGVGNLLSSGSSLYNAFSGGGMMGSFTAGMASVGSEALLGSAFVGPSATLATGAVGAGAQVGSMFGTAASGIATAIPYVGAVLAIAGALGAFDDSDIPQSGGNQAWYLGGSSFDNQQVRDRELSGGMDDEIKSGFDTLSQGLADMLKTVGASEADVTAYWYHMLNNEGKSGTFAARLFAGNPYEQSKAEQEMLYELKGKLKSDGSNFQALMAEAYTGMAKAAIGASDLSDGTKELTTYLLDNGMAVEALTANWESITQWVDSLANLNAQADESAAALVKLSGGLDAFQSVTGTYYATYFSEAEQIEILTGQLQARFDDLGLVMPDVDAAGVSAEALRAEFRGLVEGLDVTTEAGQETFVRLMALAPAFSQVADAVGAVSDASAAAAEQARQAAADLLAVRIGANVQGFQDLAQSGLSYLQSAADLESQRAQAAQQAAQESINSINSIVSTLSGAAQSLYGNVGSTASYFAAQASAQLDEMLATAQTTGYLPEQDVLNTAIQSARAGLSRDNYASTYDYERAQLVLAGKLTQLGEISKAQLPAAEQALNVANSQLTAAQQALDYYQQQVNLLLGIEESSWSLTGSIEEIGDAILESLNNQGKTIADSITTALAAGRIGAADAATQLGGLGYTDTLKNGIAAGSNGAVIAGGNLYATNGWSGSVDAARRIVAETFGAVSPEDFYTAALGVGLSGRMIEQMYDMPAGTAAAWAKANGLPAFAVGTDYVPQDMLALVHQGESITPAAYRGEQEKLLASLIAEVQALRARLDDVAENTQSTAQAVNGRGRAPMLVESA